MKEHNVPSSNLDFGYDCSIKHTDSVLSKLFRVMQNESQGKSSVIFYFSDHGEVINEGHGIMLTGDEKLKDEYQIPFVIIPSSDSIDVDRYVLPYLNDSIVNSNSVSYILSSFLGYSLDEQLIKRANHEAQYFEQVDESIHSVRDSNLFVE